MTGSSGRNDPDAGDRDISATGRFVRWMRITMNDIDRSDEDKIRVCLESRMSEFNNGRSEELQWVSGNS